VSRESPPDRVQVRFDGRQLATLNGAIVVLASWPFENEVASAMVASTASDDVERLADELGLLTRQHFEACGLWPGESPWTNTLIASRAATSVTVTLDARRVAIAVTAFRAAATEFKDRWWEFCTVAPGGLDLYGVTESDLARWADALEALLRDDG